MSNPLTPAVIAQYKRAMRLIADMFFQLPATINHRQAGLDSNGEHTASNDQHHNVRALMTYDVGMGGRYHTIEHSDIGQLLKDGWKLFFFKDDIDAIPLVVNPEADSVTISGKEYEIRMWSPSAALGTSGFQFYECDVRHNPGA